MRSELIQNIKKIELELYAAQQSLAEFDSKAENNSFDSLDEGSSNIEATLENRAHENCGDGYCGDNRITQEFIVGDKKYLGVMIVEYNRHDKRYYYVDELSFRVEEI